MGDFKTPKDQYAWFGDADGSDLVTCGIVDGGSHDVDMPPEEMRGVGSPNAYEVRPGLIQPAGSIEGYIRTTTKALLQKAIRSSGVLPEFSMSAGVYSNGRTHTYAKNESLTITLAFQAAARFVFAWKALGDIACTSVTAQTPGVGITYMWHEAAVTAGIAEKIREAVIKIEQGVEYDGGLGAPAREGAKAREAHEATEGDQKISLEIKLFTPTSIDYVSNALAELASIPFTLTNGTDILTIALTGAMINKKTMPIAKGNSRILYTIPFTVRTFNIT